SGWRRFKPNTMQPSVYWQTSISKGVARMHSLKRPTSRKFERHTRNPLSSRSIWTNVSDGKRIIHGKNSSPRVETGPKRGPKSGHVGNGARAEGGRRTRRSAGPDKVGIDNTR